MQMTTHLTTLPIRNLRFKAQAKQSQHNNIVGLALARPGQTIVTFERNTSQNC